MNPLSNEYNFGGLEESICQINLLKNLLKRRLLKYPTSIRLKKILGHVTDADASMQLICHDCLMEIIENYQEYKSK